MGHGTSLLAYFVVCGIIRLPRLNVTAPALSEASGKIKYLEGTPIPTSVVIVALLGAAFYVTRPMRDYGWTHMNSPQRGCTH